MKPTRLTRRRFTQLATGTMASASSIGIGAAQTNPASKGRVVVIGGGFGGATAARYVRILDPAIDVTLVEPSQTFYTCPFSNYVLAGFKTMNDIAHGYGPLRDKHAVRIVHDTATAIDPAAKTVRLAGGDTLSYDKLVVSPGVDMKWNGVEGYDEAAAEIMPHAWKAGPQTVLLRRQLEAMPDGGLVVIVVPATPYRCPPGPYERAAMIGYYLKSAKPRAKIMILDAKDQFPKQSLFTAGWKAVYGDMIEWVPLSKDGKVAKAIPSDMTVVTEFGQEIKASVVNFIPPQVAGQIARDSGLANQGGYCAIDPPNFESAVHKDIHVIGDAAIAGAMPRSGFAANSQGKVVALSIVNALNGRQAAAPIYVSTCYSLITPEYGISVADVYRVTPQGIAAVPGAGGLSPADADPSFRLAEARYAESWYGAMSREIWDA
jgi:sulfide dehydrogenase [flavocytochrome c] flavoprotein chain